MVGIIIVNYKSVVQTVHYVKNELSKIIAPHRIVVVNVACSDQTNNFLTKQLKACFVPNVDEVIDTEAEIFIIAEPSNVGYAKGNNIGAAFLKKHFEINHYLITNNDIEFIDIDVVEQLILKIESLPNAGAIGPKIVGRDGRDQSPAKKMGIWQMLIFPYMLYPLVYLFKKRGFFTDVLQQANEGIYYRLSGAFFLVKRKVFDAVNGFDSNTFLYAEEMIFSERMLKEGYFCYFFPFVSIIHEQGQTVNEHLNGNEIGRQSLKSKLYYYRRYRQVCLFSICTAYMVSEIFNITYVPAIQFCRNVYKKIKY